MTKKTFDRGTRDREKIKAFHLLFERCLPLTATRHDAYIMAELIHQEQPGISKPFYRNYVSFRNSRKHYMVNIK